VTLMFVVPSARAIVCASAEVTHPCWEGYSG
jgi:hypothetical protein